MTEQEYREEINKIVEQAMSTAEECSKDVGGACTHGERTTEGSCSSTEHKYDCASDVACELASEHPWLEDVDKCFEMLKLSPRRDEVFDKDVCSVFDGLRTRTFAGAMRCMAEEAFWLDVAKAMDDKAPEEVKRAWQQAEDEELERV